MTGGEIGSDEELRRTEAALRESNETLQAVIRACPVAIVTMDLEGRVRMWNEAAERLLGWSAEEVIGRPVPALGREEFRRLTEDVARGRAYSAMPATRRRKDDTLVEVSISRAPLHDGQGRLVGSVAMLFDLTPQRRLEEQVIEAQKMEAVGRLAGGIAHDFNNILSGIKGFAAILLQDLGPGDRRHEEALQIARAADRAENLTRHLLAFSRRQLLEPAVLDLGNLIDNLSPLLRRLIGEDVELSTSAHGHNRVVGDPVQIEQIILNLAVNARDAMPRGGKLTIRTSPVQIVADAGDSHPTLPAGRYVKMEVSDTGFGMDRATAARVFEPFFTTKPAGKGTGLGLSTAYGIVKQSQGHIAVASVPGKGTTFEVYLPRTEEEVTPVILATSAHRVVPPAATETVLVVEDDDMVRGLATYVLRRAGYSVLAAADGEEALSVSNHHYGVIDLMLTDVVMPRMSGPELATKLRTRRPTLRVLFMSGHGEETLAPHQLDGSLVLLEKPFSASGLLDSVRALLDDDQGSARPARND